MIPLAPLDIRSVPLAGTNLVEAAAGTGKTWTIAGLFLRIVLEQNVRVRNILVVTYTNAATQELRERIRKRLVQAAEVFRQVDAGDDHLLAHLLATSPDPALAVKRLRQAVVDFDEAAIFTIHGFCKRVLAENAFESAQPFESELLVDEREILAEVVDDFWRREVYPAGVFWVDWLHANGIDTPDALLGILRNLTGKPYLRAAALAEPQSVQPLEHTVQDYFERLIDSWRTRRAAVEKILLDDDRLNRNRYRKTSVSNWLKQMDELLKGDRPDFGLLQKFERFDRFQATVLADSRSLKKGSTVPSDPFFDACDAFAENLDDLESIYEKHYAVFKRQLYEFVIAELPARKVERGLQGYDDLLTRLQGALLKPTGHLLAEKLRTDYCAALIDEFQDTDPIQYDIFRTLYHGTDCPVFMVGDPKQAIYSFRGADIFTYLRAREDVAQRYSLDQNWRSVPALIRAANILFEPQADSGAFLFDKIDFQPAVQAPRTFPALTEHGVDGPALMIWPILRANGEKFVAKHRAGSLCAAATASEIGRLLAMPAKIGDDSLRPRDIAVLVRTHNQGRIVQEALQDAGISSVRHTQDSVYETPEAMEFERVLLAIAEPVREPLIRAALLTEFLGMDATALHSLSSLDEAWDTKIARFHHYHDLWRDQGFMRMFRELTTAEGVYQRLLGFEDGDRRLTNLLQLAELIHAQESQCAGLSDLLEWFSGVRTDPPSANDASLLRLESDEDRVRIVTVHGSKGLQYPVVFLPFSWSGGLQVAQRKQFIFHDVDHDNQATVDFGSDAFADNLGQACREELAENLRLFYVALTRARCRCYIAWGAVNDAATSPLAWLLHRPSVVAGGDPLTALQAQFKSLSDDEIRAELETLARRSDDSIQLVQPAIDHDNVPLSEVVFSRSLNAREASRQVEQSWGLASFSALATGHDTELPDHDTRLHDAFVDDEQQGIFNFPRGARAGTCLHQVFEELDFRDHEPDRRLALIGRVLKLHGFESRWCDVVGEMVDKVVHTPLDPQGTMCLADVSRAQRVDEMEFYYPFTAFTHHTLNAILESCEQDSTITTGIGQVRFGTAAGFMHGFIDLVFEASGRYYLADYKSNFLGASYDCYEPPRLEEAMVREQYVLQYLIYAVALHRYLKNRISGYHYDEHFGGIYYLFLRGMDPTLGHLSGVFFDRPNYVLIRSLDTLLGAAS